MKKKIYTLISILLWILIWFIGAIILDNELFCPKPSTVIFSFWELSKTKDFYMSILFSLRTTALGFLIGFGVGIILAVLSYVNTFFKAFTGIFMKVIKSIPVASFVILALMWISSTNLSILISALIVTPVIYTNVLTGLNDTDVKMLELAKVFRLNPGKKILYIYIPSIMSPLVSACRVSIGYAWKSGVAAEIIGLITGSIGNELYKAKLYLETPKLFAWTFTIIIVSFICERLIIFLLSLIQKAFGGITYVNKNK